LSTIRRIFLIVFALSTLGVLALSMNLMAIANAPSPALTESSGDDPTSIPEHPEIDPSSQNSERMGYTALIGTLLTSITSLVGFVTTTVITWRKEKREATLAEVQRQKLETELEKSKLELERLKRNKPKKKSK
jgi:hypothetical protein